MTMMNGTAYAKELAAKHREMVELVYHKPTLAVIQVGDDEASTIYVKRKAAACAEAHIHFRLIALPADVSQHELICVIKETNTDAILVQLPLPRHIDPKPVINAIPPEKDVDGFRNDSLFQPCTPRGIMKLLDHYLVDPTGKHAVVVGRSQIVGRPIAEFLLRANATVTICHSKTKDLGTITRQADILVSATGQANLIQPSMVKKGVVLVDAGISRINGTIYGDIHSETNALASLWTPVPGGVGPMTVAMLIDNVIKTVY